MNSSEHLDKLARRTLNVFREVSSKPEDAFFTLFVLSCFRHHVLLEFVSEKSSFAADLDLFPKESHQGEFSFTQTRLVLAPNYDLPEFLKDTYPIFQRRIEHYPFVKSKKLLASIEEDYLRLPPALYTEAFEALLRQIVKRVEKKSGEIMLPSGIAKFLLDISNLDSTASVFNPFAGLGSFGIFLKGSSTNYHGQEIDELTWAVTTLRLDAHDKLNNSSFDNVDSFLSWPESNKYDLIVSNPPFRLRLNRDQRIRHKDYQTVEQFLCGEAVNNLKKTGKLILLIPNGFLVSGNKKERDIRKFLIDSDLIESVISFPPGMLILSKVPFSVLIISKQKKQKGKILLVKAKGYSNVKNGGFVVLDHRNLAKDYLSCLEVQGNLVSSFDSHSNEDIQRPIFVTQDEIREQHYNLNIDRFRLSDFPGIELGELVEEIRGVSLTKHLKGLNKFLKKYSTANNLTQIEDLIEQQIANGNENSYKELTLVLNSIKELNSATFLSTKDLKNDPLDYTLELESIEKRERPQGSRHIKISDGIILLSLLGNSLKPSYLPKSNDAVFIQSNLVAIKTKSNRIDLDWFIYHLHSKSVEEQLEILRAGTIPYLKKGDLFKIRINLPSLNDQKYEIARIRKFSRKIDTLESDIIQQNAYLRHTLAGPVADLKNAIYNIDTIIREKAIELIPGLLTLKQTDKHLFTLDDYLKESKEKVSSILGTVKSKLTVLQNIEKKELQKLDLFKLIKEYVLRKEQSKPNFSLIFDYDKEGFTTSEGTIYRPKISGNKDLLEEVFDNLVENAKKHAFIEESDNRIEFYLSVYTEDPSARIITLLVSNNGKPVDSSISFDDIRQKGFSKGTLSGDGFGGWYIDQVIRKHNAEWDFIDETGPEGLANTDLVTSFEFNFPVID